MFSEKLKELRKRKNLTQMQFAKAFGISNGTIAMWETGKRSPDIETITNLAAFFNVSVDYLLGNDTSSSKNPTTDDELKFALFNGLDGVTDEMYEEVKNFAQMVKMREDAKRKGKK